MIDWIITDFKSHPKRFCVELIAWAVSIGCSVTVALTLPDVSWIMLYSLWIPSCIAYAWAAHSRRSFGMLANYMLLALIDTVGYSRALYNYFG